MAQHLESKTLAFGALTAVAFLPSFPTLAPLVSVIAAVLWHLIWTVIAVASFCACIAAHRPAPTAESFEPYFKAWFLTDYMPAAGKMFREHLKRKELQVRHALDMHRLVGLVGESVRNAVLIEDSVAVCIYRS